MLIVNLITLGDPNRLTGGYLYHRRMSELAPRFDARLDFVTFPDLPFPWPLLAAPDVLRRVHRSGAQAVVLDSIAAAYVGLWRALLGSGPPLLGMLHQPPGGIDHGPARTAVQALLDRLAYGKARRLLVASEALATELEERGIPRDLLLVVPPGHDVAATAGPEIEDMRRGRRAAFLCIANWIERKEILPLLEAVARLPVDIGTLHLVGDTQADRSYARTVRDRIQQPDLRDRVVVHGPVPREIVAAMYRAADVFVLPSTKEPYGTVYGEAMAAGLPVVGWRAGNLPHLAAAGREGFLITPGDIEALGHALQTLASDEQLRRGLGQAARRRALERPTWEESAALFFRAIRAAVEEASSSPRDRGGW
jgi:glycosyltransferase involved in cell wall biosynthesis